MFVNLHHMGHTGSFQYDLEYGMYCGVVLGLEGLLTFDGDNKEQAEQAFKQAVEKHINKASKQEDWNTWYPNF